MMNVLQSVELWPNGTYFNPFQLYEDSKACVLTREYLEAEQTELEEDFAVPVTIICLVGGLGKPTLSGTTYANIFSVIFIMSAITWYYLTRTEEEMSIFPNY